MRSINNKIHAESLATHRLCTYPHTSNQANEGEAHVAAQHVRRLLQAGLQESEVWLERPRLFVECLAPLAPRFLLSPITGAHDGSRKTGALLVALEIVRGDGRETCVVAAEMNARFCTGSLIGVACFLNTHTCDFPVLRSESSRHTTGKCSSCVPIYRPTPALRSAQVCPAPAKTVPVTFCTSSHQHARMCASV